jgi:hypothetical protein
MSQSSFGDLLRSKEGLDACDLLEQHLEFDESGLVSIRSNQSGIIELEFSIWEASVDQELRDTLFAAGSTRRLTLEISRFVEFRIDRYAGLPSPSLRFEWVLDEEPYTTTPAVEEGLQTVFGFQILKSSDRLDELGEFKTQFRHLRFQTLNERYSIVFAGLRTRLHEV